MDEDISMKLIQGLPPLEPSALPTFQKYKKENESWIPNFSIWSYLNLLADVELAVAFAKMFWPDFIEVDGCVILQDHYSPGSFAEWMERSAGDKRAVESVLNHIHIRDLFLGDRDNVDAPKELYEFLARALMVGWKSALEYTFPGRHFVFTLRHSYGPEISFHQTDKT